MPEISKTADLALRLLESVARSGPVTAAELARAHHLNRTVTQRLLATLNGRGYVRREDDGYLLGPALSRMFDRGGLDLAGRALPIMQGLADSSGETMTLQAIDGSDVVILEQAVSRRHVIRVEQNVIARHPLHLGATGRVLLAFSPARVVERSLAGAQASPRLPRQLDEVRAVGYATSHDELQSGVHCVAAPVLDGDGRILAALGALVPVNRAAGLDDLVDPVREAAGRIGAGTGSSVPGSVALTA